MADIFVSYARADKARVEPLVAALEAQGWSVWWDPAITPGQEFDSQISAALDAAKAVIVVWTPQSVDSRWVRGEAREAADRGVLVPVRFENAKLPIDARAMHTTDLDDWHGDVNAQAFRDLCRAVMALAERGQSQLRAAPPPAAPAPEPAKAAPPAGFWKRFSPVQMAIAAAVLVLLIGGGIFLITRAPKHDPRGGAETRSSAEAVPGAVASDQASSAAPREPLSQGGVSLAVLPFVNMSDDKEQEYFSDGLSEELLNQLAQLHGLQVAGRTSSFSFKGKNEDLRVIGETLGVTNILEGSVRKAGDQLRITAQLINAKTGYHLWSQTYDRKLDDVFKVQEEIAMAVADQLSVTLGVGDMARLSTQSTTNLEAYDKYLRGRALAGTASTPADISRAGELFREALALDPDFAPARGALAENYVTLLVFLPENADQTLKEMNETVREALAKAPDHWASHEANGVLQLQRRDWRGADASFAKVLSLAPPSESSAHVMVSLFFASAGRNADAARALEAARSADPLSLAASQLLQQNYFMVGRASDAETEYQRSKTLAGNRETSEHLALMRIWDSGDKAAIKAQIRRFLDSETVPMPVLDQVFEVFDQPPAALDLIRDAFKDPAYQDQTRLMILAWYAGHYGDSELAVAAMRRAFVDKKGIYVPAIWFPVLSEARKTQGFKQLVRDLGLYDYWRQSGKWSDHCHPLGAADFECQ